MNISTYKIYTKTNDFYAHLVLAGNLRHPLLLTALRNSPLEVEDLIHTVRMVTMATMVKFLLCVVSSQNRLCWQSSHCASNLSLAMC